MTPLLETASSQAKIRRVKGTGGLQKTMNRIDPDRPVRVQGACAGGRHGGLCFAYPLFNLEDLMIMPLTIRPRPDDVAGQPIPRPLPSATCRRLGPYGCFAHLPPTSYKAGKPIK